MGTRFRTMLAPIGVSTGDGRRFAADAMTLADLPFSFEWVREREGGHDGAVSVGVVQTADIATVKEAVAAGWVDAEKVKGWDPNLSAIWGQGEMYDDADREAMPRLAEDVAEAMHLIDKGTLGPSVDLDSFEAVPVMAGSDEPVTWDDVEDYYDQHGEEPKLELLITSGRVRAATLVTIPAFSETSRPLELIPSDETADVLALIASVGTAGHAPSIAAFDPRQLAGPTEITYDRQTGEVYGHLALWSTCHVGYADVCVTPPREPESYSWFNRFAVETADGGTVWAGRLTAGGRHAALSMTASAVMAEHDRKTTVAHVRAYADEHGIAVTGVLEPDLDARTWAILDRRKISGDWRETPGGLTLMEVLALSEGQRAHSEPGFPVRSFSRHGRQVALTAALGPVPGGAQRLTGEPLDIAAEVRRALAEDRADQAAEAERVAARAALAAVLTEDTNLQRAALVAALVTTQED